MQFVSTKEKEEHIRPAGFREAVFQGLAPDGGLYHPSSTPDLSSFFSGLTPESSFVEIAAGMTAALLGEEFGNAEAEDLCKRAFPFSPNLVELENDLFILELFHGPSCAFKDFGASFLAAVMEKILKDRGGEAIILTATSGDTGSAVAQAFYGKDNISVVILYPSGRVSPLQEKQLTTLGGNIYALEIEGNFDDCQRMVKEAFVEPELRKKLPLTSANSINLGRLLPQSFYYVWGWSRLAAKGPLRVCVPSGNFGNLTAGVLAWSWGLPVKGFIAATNVNDVVPEYLRTSVFSPRPSKRTYSNAMDVGDPSNFERLTAIFNGDWEKMRTIIGEKVVTDKETAATIRGVRAKNGMFIDPHTAVGVLAGESFLKNRDKGSREEKVMVLSTAHPGKFIEIVEEATGEKPELPGVLEEALHKPKQSILMENSLKALKGFLLTTFHSR
jgi:threonine synthase